jgi:hypothetical protein
MSPSTTNDNFAALEKSLRRSLMRGSGRVVRSQRFSTYCYRSYVMPKCVAYSEYGSPGKTLKIATGIGLSFEEASVKSLVEAYERFASTRIRVDLRSRRDMLPYPIYDVTEAEAHSSNNPLKELSRCDDVSWILGERVSDQTVCSSGSR